MRDYFCLQNYNQLLSYTSKWRGRGKKDVGRVMGEVQWGRVRDEGVKNGSKERGFKKRKEEEEVERRRGEGELSVKGEGVRWGDGWEEEGKEEDRELEKWGEGEGGKGAGLPFLMILWYNLWLYEILLLTPLSCSPSTISRQYGSQQSSEDEEEYIQ